MNNKLKNPAVWIPLLIAVAFAGGIWTGGCLLNRKSAGGTLEKLDTILKLIDAEYVDNVDIDSLLDVSIPDILSHLDPHSTYIPAVDLQSVNDELGGSFSGIGISFALMNDTITVLEVISGGPSEKVGMLPGDRIVTINDSVAVGKTWNNEKVMSNLRGPKGTPVKLGIRRNTSDKQLNFTIVRGDIPVNSVDAAYIIAPGIGYLRVNKFGANTFSEFLQNMVKLASVGAEKFIIDLRGNGGGFMETAILMANEFLPRGAMIVSTHGRLAGNDAEVGADGSGSFGEAELVVLIDEFSASASEIFAGAIQDNDRGIVIGRRSFGKGLVQNQTVLGDSSAVRLTVARYYTPSGRCIQKTYTPGDIDAYAGEILDRYTHGEPYSPDSAKINKNLLFKTISGRSVYGGGGIMPDIFVANDTSEITSYYLNVANAGLLQRFAFKFTDANRRTLASAKSVDALLKLLPDDDTLLQSFVDFAAENKYPARWYYINLSRKLIVNQLKAIIARDMLGTGAFYEIYNTTDPTVRRAISELNAGNARPPMIINRGS